MDYNKFWQKEFIRFINECGFDYYFHNDEFELKKERGIIEFVKNNRIEILRY